jgi:hypothetical protein
MAALIGNVFKETTATDRKLDFLLREPFKTATRTVKDVLSEEAQDDAEEEEATRRLQHAADRLDTAYTYAETELPNKLLLVVVYQTLVAALLKGGGARMRRNLTALRALATSARAEAPPLIIAADRIKNRENGVVREQIELYGRISRINPSVSPSRRELAFPQGLPSEDLIQSVLGAQETAYRQQAADFNRQAADIENLCLLMEVVHHNLHEILRATKHQSILKKMWRRLVANS